MTCKHCRRDFTTTGFYRQRYCSETCRARARNARRQHKYHTDATYRTRIQSRMRTYRRQTVSLTKLRSAVKYRAELVSWKFRAYRLVDMAKQAGLLKPLDGSVACVDCGAPACCYDHRDYKNPLMVDPVCLRCNAVRGAARNPGHPARKNRMSLQRPRGADASAK